MRQSAMPTVSHKRRMGRPLSLDVQRGAATERVTVRLWHDDLRTLRRLGDGNLSAGIRRLLHTSDISVGRSGARVHGDSPVAYVDELPDHDHSEW